MTFVTMFEVRPGNKTNVTCSVTALAERQIFRSLKTE